AELKRLGVDGKCQHCDGDGYTWKSVGDKTAYDEWKEYEPPTGEGYQLWETVSEGSPITPVFSSPEALANYLVSDKYRWRNNDHGTTWEQWMKFICGDGWAPGFVISGNVFQTGVQAIADTDK